MFFKWKSKKNQKNEAVLNSCSIGNLLKLEDLNDGVFSKKMLGEGIVIDSTNGEIYAPCDGSITMIFPTKHAYGITSENGLSVLIHIGLDTVQLKGQGFEEFVKLNQKVKTGDLVAKFDKNLIQKNNLVAHVIMLITPESEIQLSEISSEKNVDKNSWVIKCSD